MASKSMKCGFESHPGHQPVAEPARPALCRDRPVGRVAVGAGDSSIFLYAGSEAAAREAERVTRDLLADQNLTADLAVHRWHPAEEKWEDPSVPLPQTAAQRDAEHQQVVAGQTRESEETGLAQWEVRVDLPTHREATELAARLRAEGRNVIRRWRFLV